MRSIKNISKTPLQLLVIAAIFLSGVGVIATVDVGTVQARVPTPVLEEAMVATVQNIEPTQPAPTQLAPAPSASAQSAPTNAADTIRFSRDSQVVNVPFRLEMTSLVSGGSIHYTDNGSLPSPYTPIYSGPIAINKNTVIRAQVFNSEGKPVGEAYTKSYFLIDYAQTIPIISIAGDWGGLNSLNDNANHRGAEWERPMNMEYFTPNGQAAFNVKAGIRIHGGVSRLWSAKKSYRIYFRESYGGPGKLNYPLFKDSPVTEFDKLILRAGFNDSFNYRDAGGAPTAETYSGKYIGDQVTRNLHASMGQPIAHGDWVLLYLNGEFWGLYNLTERIDAQMLQSYSSPDADWDVIQKDIGWDVNLQWHEGETARDGDYGAWLENQEWVANADFTNPGNIGILKWRVDMENVYSYMFLQAYVQNYDWPVNNWIVYRRKDPGAVAPENQWRMMIWDAEYSFGSGYEGFKTDKNTLVKTYSPHDSISRILEKPFIGNCALKHEYVNRAREYLGVENQYNKPADQVGQLSKDKVKAEITKQAAIVRPYIQMEIDRWAPELGITADLWEGNIANSLKFVDEREDVILHHLDELRYQTFTQCQ